MIRAFAIIIIFWLCVPAWAQVEVLDLPPTLDPFEAPARELGVPKSLARAVAFVESGLKPWTLNIQGQAFWFDSKEKALAAATEAWAAGRSFDVGLMQVNSQWLRLYGVPLEAALNPLANIHFGTWILKRELERFGGDLRAAVGAYHSPTPARAAYYADLVKAALERGAQPAPGLAARLSVLHQVRPQDVVANGPLPGPEDHKMLVSPEGKMTPSGSEMVVQSKTAGLATPDSMKAAATSPEDSMKVTVKK
jgi:hypothetical protein